MPEEKKKKVDDVITKIYPPEKITEVRTTSIEQVSINGKKIITEGYSATTLFTARNEGTPEKDVTAGYSAKTLITARNEEKPAENNSKGTVSARDKKKDK